MKSRTHLKTVKITLNIFAVQEMAVEMNTVVFFALPAQLTKREKKRENFLE